MTIYFGRGITAESPGSAFTSAYDAAQLKQKQSKLADLLANAYGTQDQAQRQDYITDAIRTDPAQGMTLAKLLDPRLTGSGGKPAQQQYAEWLLSQAPADQRDQVLGVLGGYKARPSGAAITYKDGEDEFGNPIIRAFDPNNVGGTVLGTGQSYGAPVGTGMRGGGQQPMQAPDKSGMEADIALANQLAQAGFDPDKIDAFLANRGRMAQQAAPQAISQPSSGFMGRRKEAEQAAVTAAQEAVKLQYLPAQEQIKAQAAIDQARGVEQAKAGVERDSQAVAKQVDAQRALGLLNEAERLLPISTGSSAGNVVDSVAGAFGYSTPGAQAIAGLQTIAGQLTSSMPRMQGPQSDKDVQLYKQMAGDLANPNLPVQTRMAALQQIRRLNQKYAGQQAQQPQRPAASGGGVDDLLSKYGVK